MWIRIRFCAFGQCKPCFKAFCWMRIGTRLRASAQCKFPFQGFWLNADSDMFLCFCSTQISGSRLFAEFGSGSGSKFVAEWKSTYDSRLLLTACGSGSRGFILNADLDRDPSSVKTKKFKNCQCLYYNYRLLNKVLSYCHTNDKILIFLILVQAQICLPDLGVKLHNPHTSTN